MAVKPIIFSAPMVQALLAGRKTQTRRVLNGLTQEPGGLWRFGRKHSAIIFADDDAVRQDAASCEYMPIARRDRLWVREAWRTDVSWESSPPRDIIPAAPIWFDAEPTISVKTGRYRHARHMPRWASRLTLTVTKVRVQRVAEISCADAIAEGIAPEANSQTIDCDTPNPRDGFRDLWNSLHGPDAWARNDWVVAYTFTVDHRNVDGGP